jgi:hypothetical protein
MTFDANAHVTSLIFNLTGNPGTDAKLSDPNYIAAMIDGMNGVIDSMK